MKKGTHNYFNKYKWQNTKLSDFINCMNRAYESGSPTSDFRSWADSWITKAGANTLEPIIIKDEENDKFILNIRQHVPKHGDQIFRSQILDIGLYYERMVP